MYLTPGGQFITMVSSESSEDGASEVSIPDLFIEGIKNMQMVLNCLQVGKADERDPGDFNITSDGINEVGLKLAFAAFFEAKDLTFQSEVPVPLKSKEPLGFLDMLCTREAETLIIELKCVRAGFLEPASNDVVRGKALDQGGWGPVLFSNAPEIDIRTRLDRVLGDLETLKAREADIMALRNKPFPDKKLDDITTRRVQDLKELFDHWDLYTKTIAGEERVYLASVGVVGNVIAWWDLWYRMEENSHRSLTTGGLSVGELMQKCQSLEERLAKLSVSGQSTDQQEQDG